MQSTIVIPTDTDLGLSQARREDLLTMLAVERGNREKRIEATVLRLRLAAQADRRSSLIIISGAP